MPSLKMRLVFAAIVAVSISVGCSIQSTKEQQKVHKLTVLHTNDHHGRFWRDEEDQYGMSARQTLVNQIRKEVAADGGHVLLLSGGDINTGVPESDMQNAVPDFLGMNMLGYDAMAVGNHEFDKPRDVLKMQQEISNFPFLSANIVYKESGDLLFQPYTEFDFDGLKVSVLGLTTLDTLKTASPQQVEDLKFLDPVEGANKYLPELRKKSDIVIAATHMGHYENGNHRHHAPGDVTLARKTSGIDLIVGGHSQRPLFEPDVQNGTYIVQAHEWGKYVGRADFEYFNGTLVLNDYKLIPVNHKTDLVRLEENKDMLAMLRPYRDKAQKILQTHVGHITGDLDGERRHVRSRPTNMGVFLTNMFREQSGADIAIISGGNIRYGLRSGDLTYRNLLMVLPFFDTMTTVEMTGKELQEYLSVVTQRDIGAGFPHFSGISMHITQEGVNDIKVNHQPIEMDKTYKMAMLNYLSKGGDGYPDLSDMPTYVNSRLLDVDLLTDYVKKNSPIRAEDYMPSGISRDWL